MLDSAQNTSDWATIIAATISSNSWPIIIGFLSSIMSILGIPITIYRVMRAQNAAEAARKAVDQTREELSTFQSASGLSMSIERLESLKVLHRNSAWAASLERYPLVRSDLINVREKRKDALSDQNKAVIQSAITLMGQLEQQVEKAILKNSELPEASKVNKQVTSILEKLRVILHGMEAESTGGRDA